MKLKIVLCNYLPNQLSLLFEVITLLSDEEEYWQFERGKANILMNMFRLNINNS